MKRIIRLTESDLTRIVRRVIMEQTEDPEISKALDELKIVLSGMMDNIVGKNPNSSERAAIAKTSLETYLNKAKNMQLETEDVAAKTAFAQTYKLLTLAGKGGYKPYENLRKMFTDLRTLQTRTGYLNQSYDSRQKPDIIKLISGVSNDLKRLIF